ncbi:MAG: peptidase C39, partial [Betaproteobacteria bacterium]
MRKSIAVAVIALSLEPGLASGLGNQVAALAGDKTRPVRSLIEQRQRNVVLQQWELSCAAAALATILR